MLCKSKCVPTLDEATSWRLSIPESKILVTVLINPSIYPNSAVVISPGEAVIIHLQRELCTTSLYNISCQTIGIGPNSGLTRIPIRSLTEEQEYNMVVQRLKEECPADMHYTLARILPYNQVSAETIVNTLD